MNRILLIEDDNALRESLTEILSIYFQVVACGSLAQGNLILKSDEVIDLLLLDLGLPDGNGMELIGQVHQLRPRLPVFILSGKDDPSIKIAGLDLGACDYIVKPFDAGELNARIRARLRDNDRSRTHSRVYSKYGLEVDEGRLKVFVERDGRRIDADLSPVEFKLLIHFIENEGQVFSRDQLITSCSGSGYTVSGRSIDVHVCSLRKKLGGVSQAIRTVYGSGYMFDPSRVADSFKQAV